MRLLLLAVLSALVLGIISWRFLNAGDKSGAVISPGDRPLDVDVGEFDPALGPPITSVTDVSARVAADPEPVVREEQDMGSFTPLTDIRDAREYLKGYWGPRWPEVLAEVEARGIDVDAIDISQWRSWDDAFPWALEGFESAAGTPDSPRLSVDDWFYGDPIPRTQVALQESATWNPTRKSITPTDFDVFERISAEHDSTLADLASRWIGVVYPVARQSIIDGSAPHHPVFFPTFAHHNQENVAYFLTGSSTGWTFEVVVELGDYPELRAILELRSDVFEVRADELSDFISGL